MAVHIYELPFHVQLYFSSSHATTLIARDHTFANFSTRVSTHLATFRILARYDGEINPDGIEVAGITSIHINDLVRGIDTLGGSEFTPWAVDEFMSKEFREWCDGWGGNYIVNTH